MFFRSYKGNPSWFAWKFSIWWADSYHGPIRGRKEYAAECDVRILVSSEEKQKHSLIQDKRLVGKDV